MTTWGYIRVSTDEQADSHAGLDAQAHTITTTHTIDEWVADEGVSGAIAPDDRPALGNLLARMRKGDTIVCAKLDRLSRRMADVVALLERCEVEGWHLAIIDLQVDTSTPVGRFLTHMLGPVSELERRMIGERTRDALAARKRAGMRLGRPVGVTEATRDYVVALRESGLSLRAIAIQLADEGVPTSTGGQWYASTVRSVLNTARLDHEAAAITV